MMISFCTNLILLVLFSSIIVLSFQKERDIINALIIFHSINAVKVVFLYTWAIYQTGTIYLPYLQFPDEYYYVSFKLGDPIGNLYNIIVWFLQSIGFDISNLKMVNILVSSFAIVRLYTLKDLVRNKDRYIIYLLTIGGVFFLHITYYSIFVLKDALFFYVTVEFLIQLINRPRNNRWIVISLLIVILAAIRNPMVLVFFTVFLFDKNWRISQRRLLLFILLGTVSIVYYEAYYMHTFYKLVAWGLYRSLRMTGSIRELREYASTGILSYPGVYCNLVFTNIRLAIDVFYQVDVTNQLILFLEWCAIFWLLLIKKNIKRILEYWPILMVSTIYFVGAIMTMYNIRYNILPVTFLLYLSIFVSSGPYKKGVV